MKTNPPYYVAANYQHFSRVFSLLLVCTLAFEAINQWATNSLQMLFFALAALIFTQTTKTIRAEFSLAYLFWLVSSVYMLTGMAIYEYREAYYFNFSGDVKIPYNIWIITTLITGLSSLLGEFRTPSRVIDDYRKIRYSILFTFFCAGLVSAMVIFRSGIPIFSEDISQARSIAVESNKGLFWFMYMSLQILTAALLIRLFFSRRKLPGRILDFSILIVMLLALSLYGGRFFVFFPLLMYSIYAHNAGRLTKRTVALFGATLLVIAVGVSASRFSGAPGIAGDSLLFVAIRNDFFPEARTLIQMSTLIRYFDISYFYSPFISFLPNAVYDAIGLNKNDLMLSIGYYLNSFDESGQSVGYRITILGETFLAFGYFGVAALVLIMNLLSRLVIDRFAAVNLFTRTYVILMCVMLIPYGVTFFRSGIIMLPFGLLIISMLRKPKRQAIEKL